MGRWSSRSQLWYLSLALPVIVPRLTALFRTAPSMMTAIAGVPLP